MCGKRDDSNLMKTAHANRDCHLTAGQALRRWKRRKEGRFWHTNNSAPTGRALRITYILERVPETPGARGCPALAKALAVRVSGAANPPGDRTVTRGRERQTLRFLP